MKFELFRRYYKDILKNKALLLLISSLSVIAPLLLRNAMDITFQGGFRAGMLLWYLIVLTFLYSIKFACTGFGSGLQRNSKMKKRSICTGRFFASLR